LSAVRRGIKNTFRNSIRAVAIVIILGLSIALALVMLLSMKAVDSRITQVKHDVGNKITVRAAGFRGFEGGGNPLTAANVVKVARTPHVVTAVPVVTDRLRNENSVGNGGPGGFSGQSTSNTTTSLTSPISPGTLGQRFGGDQNGTTQQTLPANFSLPVTVTGTSRPADPRALQVDSISLTAGTSFDGSGTALEALVGTDLATKNSLSVGSTFTAWGETITVTGIYKTGDTFADAGILMPIGTVEKLSGQTGPTAVYVTVDSVDHLDAAVSAITKQLGTAADVAADSSASVTTLDSLQNIKTISTYSLVGALVAAVVITFLLMLMIVRERRREIGVLKSIGGSNSKITLQFVAEAVTFTLMAAVAGILVGIILANPVLDVLVKNSSDTTTATATFGPRGQGRGFPGQGTGGNANGNSGATAGNRPSTGGQINFGRGFGRTFSNVGGTLDNLKTAVGFDIVLYGILAALLVAIVGSALPAYSISKVRPAEVMRSE
jgi:putative ABC transport system permease protein